MSMLGEALVASAASIHTLRKQSNWVLTAQAVRFTLLFVRSLISSLLATNPSSTALISS